MNVILTAGPADRERAAFGLDAAIAAAASGFDVLVFLTLDASALGCATFEACTAPELDERLESLLEMRVEVTCCSNCALELCADPASERPSTAVLESTCMRPGVTVSGLTTLMRSVARGGTTVTF